MKLICYLLPLILIEGPDNDSDPLQQKCFSVCSLIFSVLGAQTEPTSPVFLDTQNSPASSNLDSAVMFPVHDPQLCVFMKSKDCSL